MYHQNNQYKKANPYGFAFLDIFQEKTTNFIHNTEYRRITEMIEIIEGFSEGVPEDFPERIPFNELESRGIELYVGNYIGESAPLPLQTAMINLLECLWDVRYIFPAGQYKIFKVLEDCRIGKGTYGDASGSEYSDLYHSLLIEYKGKEEIVSIGLSSSYDNQKTYINVAIDNDEISHHSLQLNVDDNVKFDGDIVKFYHSGRIAVGNIGSGKISELREFVGRDYPEIICNKMFFLGELKNNHLWNISDKEVVKFIENLISYALVRDEYREYRKKKKAKE